MKFLPIILFFSSLFVGCRDHKPEGVPLKLNSGFYRIIDHGEGAMAKENEYVFYNLLFVDDQGKVFLDRRGKEQVLRERIQKDSFSMENLSPVSELLHILSKGDSAILKIPLKKEEKVDEFSDSDSLIFYIKVVDIMDEKKVLNYLSNKFLNKEHGSSGANKEYSEARNSLMTILRNEKKTSSDVNKMKTPNGLEYVVIKKGDGERVLKGQKARFNFIALAASDQREIDNSYSKPDDVEIVVGAKQEIAGWDEALSVMNTNMVAVFFIPSGMAYGLKGKKGIIPPDTDLIYLIELNDILN